MCCFRMRFHVESPAFIEPGGVAGLRKIALVVEGEEKCKPTFIKTRGVQPCRKQGSLHFSVISIIFCTNFLTREEATAISLKPFFS